MFSKWKSGLERTRKSAFGRLAQLLGASEITEETWDNLEALLIQADLGVQTTLDILDALREQVQQEGITRGEDLRRALKAQLLQRLQPPLPLQFAEKPTVIMIVGVNGSGKTTTIAKLAHRYQAQGLKVILGAADTFRAAAIDQLKVWGERLGVPVIAGQPGGDPGAVAYDTVQAAVARGMDLAFIDTAGRLHTRYNLMEELKKVRRAAAKALFGAPHRVWLVMDATTGQNALQQAKAFQQAVSVNGIILAKLDSSAKGGMAFAIQKELGLPILFAGLGERPEDLEPFNPEAFVQGILTP
ncbi:MAG TPA: signal recognition particle-docking protein FtsY [Anaerolineae bacterium]|nr:signal recognition particle-docking protein FtsY [Anaerolineae bacterium]HID84596.1 signal recognition particle-docking protein FtsY [Anaerolineales bacterium]HIQ08400.1 signal recognition particle-docking protein FtsY [Anaerolineaceae bacterium]